jgi:hypothetical protein
MSCAICLKQFNVEKSPWSLSCGHSFHSECFEKTNSRECPTCRRVAVSWTKNYTAIALIENNENIMTNEIIENYENIIDLYNIKKKEHLKLIGELEERKVSILLEREIKINNKTFENQLSILKKYI